MGTPVYLVSDSQDSSIEVLEQFHAAYQYSHGR